MRCHICNKDNAEHHDKRDNTFLCTPCHEDVQEIILTWLISDPPKDGGYLEYPEKNQVKGE